MARRTPLDYASADATRTSGHVRRRWIVPLCCFSVSWIVWLIVALATLDSFDDAWLPWVSFITLVAGTASGIVSFAVANVLVELGSEGSKSS